MSTVVTTENAQRAFFGAVLAEDAFASQLRKQRFYSAAAPPIDLIPFFSDAVAAVFGNPVEDEFEAIIKFWLLASDTKEYGGDGRRGSWKLAMERALGGKPKYHVVSAQFAKENQPPFDQFTSLLKPLSQAKTRRKVSKLKHHRVGYTLERAEPRGSKA